MKKLLIALLLLTGVLPAFGQSNIAGTLYATNFANWIVVQPTTAPGSFSWPSATFCQVSSSGSTFPAFAVGAPVKIIDADPSKNETVSPTAVQISGSGCSITIAPVYKHQTFHFASATGGLQEAINFANAQNLPALVYVTPDFGRVGGSNASFTQVKGNSNVSIQDARTSVIVPYIWNNSTSVYDAHPFSTGGGGNLDGPQDVVGSYTGPGVQSTIGPSGDTSAGTFVDHATKSKFRATTSVDSKRVGGVYNVLGFGAVADGKVCDTTYGSAVCTYSGTDNTASFQAAADYICAAGGGTLYVPSGIWNISNTAGAPRQSGSHTTNVAAFTYGCSKLVLAGDGPGNTVLSFWVITPSDGIHHRITDICPVNPDFTPETLPPGAYSFPRTWRGSILYVVGSTDAAHHTTGIGLHDLTLEGNAVVSRNSFNPVRQDSTMPLPPYSQCNAWDTSNKGLYFQNNDFNLQPTDGAYYRPVTTYVDHASVNNVEFRDILGEHIYAGNPIKDLWVTNSQFANTNGDFISVAGGHTLLNNVGDNCAANGFENPVTEYPVTDRGNHITNCVSGINEINFDYTLQHPKFPPVIIESNTLENIIANALYMFDPYNYKVSTNTLIDCAWRGYNLDSSSCINLYANLPPNPVQWGPDGPTTNTATPTASGGSFAAGTYSFAATWAVTIDGVNGQTSSVIIPSPGVFNSACITLSVAANGTVTLNKPSETPPTGTTGWYPYAIAGSTCDASHLPNLQMASSPAGFPPIPLSAASIVLTSYIANGPNSPVMPWPNSGNTRNGYVVYPSNATNTTVQLNSIISKNASISTGIGGWGAPSALQPVWAKNVVIANNTPTHLLDKANSPHAAPASCPTLTSVAGPPYTYAPQAVIGAGTYYFQYTELWPEGETQPSPECSITIGAGRQINVTPSAQTGFPFFKVYASTTSGQEIIQDNFGNSFTAAYNTYTQQYGLRTTADGGGYVPPPTQPVTGTTFKAGTGFPTAFNVASNSLHARSTTIHDNDSTGTLSGAVENQACISLVLTTTGDTTCASFTPVTEGNVQISFMYKVQNASTTINARVTYRAPDGSFPTMSLTPQELASGTGQSVNGAWYQVNVPDLTVTTGFPVSIIVTAGTANNITVHGSISSKGQIQ